MPRCAFITFGCKVNQCDTQALREALARLGYAEAPAAGEADLYVVNTCCVTAESHRKGLEAVRRLARRHPAARIVVTGCSVDAASDSIRSLPGVHLIAPNAAKPGLADAIAARIEPTDTDQPSRQYEDGLLPAPSPVTRHASRVTSSWPPITRFAGHTRAFVKIEDGCDDFCSYCIVPHVRGRVRSRPADSVADEVARLAANGYPEIVLTGIHLGAYGLDTPSSSSLVPRPRSPELMEEKIEDEEEERGRGRAGRPSLLTLIERLLGTPGLRRLRLSSLELREATDELAALIAASPILCPHLHIPLQSGDDAVLRAMNRRYTAAEFLRRIEAIRARIPEPAITTDIIVGFPGETAQQFRRTLAVAREAAFSRIHVFPYSDRPGTPAALLPGKLPWPVIKARRDELKALAAELMDAFHRRFLGRTVLPLAETARDPRTGLLAGYTERYIRTLFPGPDALCGTIVPVRATAATPAGLRGDAGACGA